MTKPRTLAAAFALAIPLVAHGQASYPPERWFDDRWYLTPFGTYVLADSDRRSDDGWGGGLAVGKPIHPNWNIELRAMYERLGAESGGPGKYENWSGSLDAHWYFLGRAGVRHWRPDSVQPYLIAGIGAINDKVEGSSTTPSGDKTSFMWNAGVGVRLAIFVLGPLRRRRALPLGRQPRRLWYRRQLRRLAVQPGTADPARAAAARRGSAARRAPAGAGPRTSAGARPGSEARAAAAPRSRWCATSTCRPTACSPSTRRRSPPSGAAGSTT